MDDKKSRDEFQENSPRDYDQADRAALADSCAGP